MFISKKQHAAWLIHFLQESRFRVGSTCDPKCRGLVYLKNRTNTRDTPWFHSALDDQFKLNRSRHHHLMDLKSFKTLFHVLSANELLNNWLFLCFQEWILILMIHVSYKWAKPLSGWMPEHTHFARRDGDGAEGRYRRKGSRHSISIHALFH